MMFRARLASGAFIALLLYSSTAEATTFTVTIRNTSGEDWSAGLIAKVPLFQIGLQPAPGDPFYPTLAFATDSCDIDDAICPIGICDDDANPGVLAARMGLFTSGPNQNAWIVPPIVNGGQQVLVINAEYPERMSYISTPVGATFDDDIWMARQYDSEGDVMIDLFNSANGLPVDDIIIEYLSYDFDSVNPTLDDGTSCRVALCPPQPPMCFVTFRREVLPPTLPATGFVLQAMYEAPAGQTDTIVMSDMQPGGAAEIIGINNGGNYVTPPFATGNGRVRVFLQSNLTERSPVVGGIPAPDGHELLGFTAGENLIGAFPPNEFVFAESNRINPMAPDVPARVHLLQYNLALNQYQIAWSSSPYHYPGFWNMGPSTGNVRTDAPNPGNEVIIADLGGHLAVLNSVSGTTLHTFDMFNMLMGEIAYGHASVANVDGLAGNEIVVIGGRTGTTYAFAAPPANGPLNLVYMTEAGPNGSFAFGNGPAISNIDNDANNEIVVLRGNLNEVRAYSVAHGTGCEHQWTSLAGNEYYWTSPIIADVDGDTQKEIIVFSNDSWLSVLRANVSTPGVCTEGQVVWEYEVGNGGPAWFSPAAANVVQAAVGEQPKLDILVANYETVEVVDVFNRRPAYRFSAPGARFYPSGLIQNGPGGMGNPGSLFYLTGWGDRRMYRLRGPLAGPVPAAVWLTFQGDNQRTGAR